MKEHYDPWYVRLPDGRTIKAKSTTSVRHHVEAGHVPLNSQVRRDSEEEWVNIVYVAEFADLASRESRSIAHAPPKPPADAPPGRSGVSARLDPMRLQTVGVRGLIDELIAALDSTLTKSKLVPAFLAAVLIYLGFFVSRVLWTSVSDSAGWLPIVVGSGFALVVLSALNALLARLTHNELSTMRPAKLRDALGSVTASALPVFLANLVVAGGAMGILFLLTKVPGWTLAAFVDWGMGERTADILFTPVLILVKLFSVLAWVVVGLCWLLTPAIVVEESSWLGGIREWRQLVREHFGRIVLYEGLTLLFGIAIALPLTLAVGLALHGYPAIVPAWPVGIGTEQNWVTGSVDAVLHAVAAAPMIALLGVANVFIYLNLRYEHGK